MRKLRGVALVLALVALGTAGCTNPGGGSPGGGGGTPSGGKPHIVFVHGFTAEAGGSWSAFRPAAIAAGFQTDVFTYPSLTIGADAAANLLGQTVQRIAASGQRVALIGHSEGGLVTKACIIYHGCKGNVSYWFDISGVNNGTLISGGIPGSALGDMSPTSPLVTRLKAGNAQFRAQGIKCRVAYTLTDGLVYPPTASLEPGLGCSSVMSVGTTHFTILVDPVVIQSALQLLNT